MDKMIECPRICSKTLHQKEEREMHSYSYNWKEISQNVNKDYL